jgi:hypothetical protein
MPSRHLLRAVWPAQWLPPEFVAWRNHPDTSRRALAVHEAAHAVALMVGGSGTVGAVLYDEPLNGASGQAFGDITQPRDSPPPPINSSDTALGGLWSAVIFHAGVQSELLDFGCVLPGELRYAAKDFDDASKALSVFPLRAPHGWAQAASRALLTENWQTVSGIAKVLIERGQWQVDASTPPVKFSGAALLFAVTAAYDSPEH